MQNSLKTYENFKRTANRLGHYFAFVAGTGMALLLGSTLSAQTTRPIVVYDEAHNNHPSKGPIGEILEIGRSIGYEIRIGSQSLDVELKSGANLLVISGAWPLPRAEFFSRFSVRSGNPRADWPMYWMADFEQPAYSPGEIRAVVDWVHSGGGLLLVVDHAPSGAAVAGLVRAIGAEVRNVFTWDIHRPPGNPRLPTDKRKASNIFFTRETGTIGNHPILSGASGGEEVTAVATYVGSSIQGPIGSTPLLILSDSALDYFRSWPDGPEHWLPAAGRSQAVAYELGRGRVVIVGEAAALMKDGLDYPLAHNRRFARNVLLWLMSAAQSGEKNVSKEKKTKPIERNVKSVELKKKLAN